MERQHREEWERAKREELGRRRGGEQEEISRLRAKKKSLELELEDVVRRSGDEPLSQKAGAHTDTSVTWSHRETSTSRSRTASGTLRARGGF